jgi:hypothetical protein
MKTESIIRSNTYYENYENLLLFTIILKIYTVQKQKKIYILILNVIFKI